MIDAEADLPVLSEAIYNRGYILVVCEGKYHGMITYDDFHRYMGGGHCIPCKAKDLCNPEYESILETDLCSIFPRKENFLQLSQCIFPVLDNGTCPENSLWNDKLVEAPRSFRCVIGAFSHEFLADTAC